MLKLYKRYKTDDHANTFAGGCSLSVAISYFFTHVGMGHGYIQANKCSFPV